MNIEYLGNHSKRLGSLDQLQEGEVYAVGRGKDAFIGFVMPGESRVWRNHPQEGALTLNNIDLYEARLRSCGKEIADDNVERNSDLHLDSFLDVEVMQLFKPTSGSRLRKTITDALKVPATSA